ncbi:MAG: hypothetical protein K1X72_00420 [Pyrinomonadaceae bacterium]|nr:hypothetical protein [Pyrinomonadaceae bacterium]
MQIQNIPNYQNFQAPPPPPIFDEQRKYQQFQPPKQRLHCIKCGRNQNVSFQTFTKKYVSPVATLGIFLGFLPFFLLRLLLTTKHEISTTFCELCWENFRNLESKTALIYFGGVMALIVSVTIAGIMNSFSPLIFGVIVFLPMMIWGFFYNRKYSPKFKKVNENRVTIVAPVGGEITFYKQK